MEILIMPTVDYLREIRGYDVFDDEDDEALLFEQGYEGVQDEIEDGETFEIPQNYIGRIVDEREFYFHIEIMENVFDKQLANDCNLVAGKYLLEGDTITKQ